MLRHLLFVTLSLVIILIIVLSIPQPVHAKYDPSLPNNNILPELITHTLYIPFVARAIPPCDPAVAHVVLQEADVSGFDLDIDGSGPIELSDVEKGMGAITSCATNYIHPALIFTITVIVINRVILFEDSNGAETYLTHLHQETATLTGTQQIDAPQIGDKSTTFETISPPFSVYLIEFRKGRMVGMIGTIGWTGAMPLENAIEYARVVESRIEN